MRLSYALTYPDFRALNRVLLAYRGYDRSIHLRNILGSWLVLLVVVMIFRYFSPPDLLPESSDFLVTAVLAAMIATALIYLAISYINWLSTIRQSYELQGPFQTYTFEFTDDGLHVTGPDANANVQWGHFVRCVADDNYLFLVNNGVNGYVFPRSAFRKISDFNAAVRLATEKVHG
jgi:hypothetical protein